MISFSFGGWHRPSFSCCWVVHVGQEGFLYAGLFLVCSRGAGEGHPRVVPVLGGGEGVVSLEGGGGMADCCVGSTVKSSAGGVMGCVSGVGVSISDGLVAS